jgi:hypothetical protein
MWSLLTQSIEFLRAQVSRSSEWSSRTWVRTIRDQYVNQNRSWGLLELKRLPYSQEEQHKVEEWLEAPYSSKSYFSTAFGIYHKKRCKGRRADLFLCVAEGERTCSMTVAVLHQRSIEYVLFV